jgi:hypothetical protein
MKILDAIGAVRLRALRSHKTKNLTPFTPPMSRW